VMPTDADDPEFTAADREKMRRLEHLLREHGYVKDLRGFWVVPGAVGIEPQFGDIEEDDEAKTSKSELRGNFSRLIGSYRGPANASPTHPGLCAGRSPSQPRLPHCRCSGTTDAPEVGSAQAGTPAGGTGGVGRQRMGVLVRGANNPPGVNEESSVVGNLSRSGITCGGLR